MATAFPAVIQKWFQSSCFLV